MSIASIVRVRVVEPVLVAPLPVAVGVFSSSCVALFISPSVVVCVRLGSVVSVG